MFCLQRCASQMVMTSLCSSASSVSRGTGRGRAPCLHHHDFQDYFAKSMSFDHRPQESVTVYRVAFEVAVFATTAVVRHDV